MKKHRFKPVQGLASQSIVAILKTCRKETKLGDLLIKTIQFKNSLLKYLRFMLKKKLITRKIKGNKSYYKTTKKGEKLMKLLCYTDRVQLSYHRWKK